MPVKMVKIRFTANKYPEFEVAVGSLLMKVLLDRNIPVASSCHGDGICGKCKIKVLNGAENLSAVEELEKTLCERLKIQFPHRISCQTLVMGDIEIDTTYW